MRAITGFLFLHFVVSSSSSSSSTISAKKHSSITWDEEDMEVASNKTERLISYKLFLFWIIRALKVMKNFRRFENSFRYIFVLRNSNFISAHLLLNNKKVCK
jgi:hypothetical protein